MPRDAALVAPAVFAVAPLVARWLVAVVAFAARSLSILLRLGALLGRRAGAFAARRLPILLRLRALLLRGARRPVAALVGDVLAVFLPVFARVLAVVVEVFARVFAVVVEVVPGVVVHVAAAVPPVRTVVVVVVHGRADRDAGGEPDDGASGRGFGAVVFFLDHDGRSW